MRPQSPTGQLNYPAPMTTHSVFNRAALVFFLLFLSFGLGFVTRRFAINNTSSSPGLRGLPHALVYPALALPAPHPLQLP